MIIEEVVPGHQFLKKWDYYENLWWLGYSAMYDHMNDVTNPHAVTAAQVTIAPNAVDPNPNLQKHVEDSSRHIHWGEQQTFKTTGLAVLGTSGKITLPNANPTRNELLFIDGLLKAKGATDDYTVQNFVANPTEIDVIDPTEVLHDQSIVIVLYEERK